MKKTLLATAAIALVLSSASVFATEQSAPISTPAATETKPAEAKPAEVKAEAKPVEAKIEAKKDEAKAEVKKAVKKHNKNKKAKKAENAKFNGSTESRIPAPATKKSFKF